MENEKLVKDYIDESYRHQKLKENNSVSDMDFGFMVGVVLLILAILAGALACARLSQAHSVEMSATVELTDQNAYTTCCQEMCGHLK
jgi:hypothetical protein